VVTGDARPWAGRGSVPRSLDCSGHGEGREPLGRSMGVGDFAVVAKEGSTDAKGG
jgi:hypothetical protein